MIPNLLRQLGLPAVLGIPAVLGFLLGGLVSALTVRSRLLNRVRAVQKTLNQASAKLESAQQANLAKGEFLASMSHEMRTPMTGILNFAEMALKTDLSPVQREYLDRLIMSAEWLKHVLSDVLDFSRLEASRLELETREFSLLACVRSAVKMVEAGAAKKNLDLTFKLHPSIPSLLRGDSNRLRQVMVNLLDNAIRFTTSGGVMLGACVEAETPESVTVAISIADTGIGITPEKQKVIFEPFRGYQRREEGDPGGTGLGLSICKRLTEMMGGGIEVQSHVGAGSTFRFTVSCGKVLVCQQAPEDVEIFSRLNSRRLGVLIADENTLNRRMVAKLFESCGHQVSSVGVGKEALDVYCSDIFDLVLISMHLPDLDAAALTKSLRELECEGTRTYIYVLRAAGDPELPRDFDGFAIDGLLGKPAQLDELMRLANQIAESRNVLERAR